MEYTPSPSTTVAGGGHEQPLAGDESPPVEHHPERLAGPAGKAVGLVADGQVGHDPAGELGGGDHGREW